MVVKFRRIEILYYKSITSAELNYTDGVWLVQGVNNDSFGSNGAGKSTLLEALQQCLYNRTTKGTTLDSTINRKTGKQYKLTVYLDVDGTSYKVVNDRTSLKITIYKLVQDEWVDELVRSIPAALTYIQTLIGLDFQSFVALTHITHSTVTEMTDNLSNSNLIKVLLDFGILTRFEKKAKEIHKGSQVTSDKLLKRKHEIEANLKLIDTFKPIDTTKLNIKLASLNLELMDVQQEIDNVFEYYTKQEQDTSESLSLIKKDIENISRLTTDSVCPTCGCDVAKYQGYDVAELEAQLQDLLKVRDGVVLNLENIMTEKSNALNPWYEKRSTLSTAISELSNQIHVAEYNKSIYDTNKSTRKALQVELIKINNQIPKELDTQEVLVNTLSVLKKGTLQFDTLKEFTEIVNLYIAEYLNYVSVDYIKIYTLPNKGGFDYKVFDTRYNVDITFNELSGGELTRVRLVILLAVLKSIQIMTNTSVNTLVFDEALDTLDKSAAIDLARLFNHLVENNEQFIGMVSHGEQLSEIKFNGTITVTKTDNSSTVQHSSL